jgi:hypothetical protein
MLYWVRPLIGYENFLIGMLTMLVFSQSLMTFATSKSRSLSFHQFTARMDILQDQIRLLEHAVAHSSGYDWILTRDQIMKIESEKKSNCGVIWILTPDLTTDTGECLWADTVRLNASAGIYYHYICVRTPGAEEAAAQLLETFYSYQNRCFVCMITQEEYERFPYAHIVVYDPNNSNESVESFAELEISQKGYWIKLTSERENQVIEMAREKLLNQEPISHYGETSGLADTGEM